MAKQSPGSDSRVSLSSVIVLLSVFGLVIFLVSIGHDPAVSSAVASTAGLTATEIARRLRKGVPAENESDKRGVQANG